jgi:hypothetical protein
MPARQCLHQREDDRPYMRLGTVSSGSTTRTPEFVREEQVILERVAFEHLVYNHNADTTLLEVIYRGAKIEKMPARIREWRARFG